MPVQYWESMLNAGAPWQGVAGTTWSTVTTIGDIGPQPDFVFPANWFYPGAVVQLTAAGHMNCSATATNMNWTVYWGATNTAGVLSAGTALATTGAIAMAGTAITGAPWFLNCLISCRSVGATGTFLTLGQLSYVATGGVMSQTAGLPLSTVAPVTVATNAANALQLGATISQVTGAPSITCDFFLIEAMN